MSTTVPASKHRTACATLPYLAEPSDPILGGLLQVLTPAEILACIRCGVARHPRQPLSCQDGPGPLARPAGVTFPRPRAGQ